MKVRALIGAAAVSAATLIGFGGTAQAASGADEPPSIVEDYSYPGAAQILADHKLKLIAGDGHILFVTSHEYGKGQCDAGQIQVEEALATAPFGVYYCFSSTGKTGFLTLEVPATFGVHTGNTALVATATIGGTEKQFPIEANGYKAVDPGVGDQLPTAVLVELRLAG